MLYGEKLGALIEPEDICQAGTNNLFCTTELMLKGKAIEKSPSCFIHSEEEDSDDSEDDGVDEEGMVRLMKALGEDGLDEIGRAELEALAESSEDEGEESNDKNVKGMEGSELERSGDEDVQLSDEEDNEEQEAQAEEIAMDEAYFVDEDAIPHQKVEVDNKVCSFNYFDFSFTIRRLHLTKYENQ